MCLLLGAWPAVMHNPWHWRILEWWRCQCERVPPIGHLHMGRHWVHCLWKWQYSWTICSTRATIIGIRSWSCCFRSHRECCSRYWTSGRPCPVTVSQPGWLLCPTLASCGLFRVPPDRARWQLPPCSAVHTAPSAVPAPVDLLVDILRRQCWTLSGGLAKTGPWGHWLPPSGWHRLPSPSSANWPSSCFVAGPCPTLLSLAFCSTRNWSRSLCG